MSEAGLDVRPASESEAPVWDGLVDSSPHGTLYHRWAWLKIAEKHSVKRVFGERATCKLIPLMAFDRQEPVAVLPLFHYGCLGYEIVTSPPLKVDVHYLGPVIRGYESLRQSKRESVFTSLVKAVDEYVLANFNPLFTTIMTSPGLLDSRPFSWRGYDIVPKYTYENSLREDASDIFDGFAKTARQNINSASAAGVEIKAVNGGVDSIYDILFERHEGGGHNQMGPREYYREVYGKFSPTNLRTFLAYHNGDVIGGSIVILRNDKVQLWFGSTKKHIIGVNELKIWEVMKWAMENGFTRFENMGADYQHLCTFKSKLNPQIVPHFSAKKNNSRVYDKLTLLSRLLS